MRRVAPLLLPLGFAACAPAGEALANRRISIVATTGIVADIARNVGGDRIAVEALMGPGVDPHLYKASEGDVRLLAEADLILYNGLHLEAKLADVLERLRGQTSAVAAAERVPREKLLTPPEFAGAYDPHVWFDVSLWMTAVERVRDGLVELDSAHASEYRANADRYLAELRTLDAYVREQAGRVPDRLRVLVTAHDAFNYFGRAYGFEVRGLQGISTATEAGTGDVQALADFIASRRIPAIFVESSVSPRAIEAVQAAVRGRGFDVRIGGQLYSDALGTAGTPAGTYLGMVRHNVDTIVRALLGETTE
ncbi:MAG: zinc ABC transporter substrate-binding protein [Gemmatimonadota bacterium]|nr:zinc ABC transporter substrate-binding protein [Gemmatimonadota bacterium]